MGALQYCVVNWPEIAYAVNKLYQFLHAPTDLHWQVARRVLRYLKGTASHGNQFHKSDVLSMIDFFNSDYASGSDDRHSTSAYCIYFGNNLIT